MLAFACECAVLCSFDPVKLLRLDSGVISLEFCPLLGHVVVWTAMCLGIPVLSAENETALAFKAHESDLFLAHPAFLFILLDRLLWRRRGILLHGVVHGVVCG